MDNKIGNIPSVSVSKFIDLASELYSMAINNGKLITLIPSIMLWGPPGIGKSQAITQLAAEIEAKTGKRTNTIDVRLILFNPIDLRGIPTSNVEKTLAVWLKPSIFQMDEADNVVNILFLDEISAAPPSVQAAAYQITLDRKIGEHKLPDNCIVIAAGNRVTDKSVAYNMPKALANRLMHFEIETSFGSWKEWALSHGINNKVIGFLSFKRDYHMTFESANDNLAFATPRSWQLVSNILNLMENKSISELYPAIAGLVGTGIACEFKTWAEVYAKIPSVENIFWGKDVAAPKDTDVLYALVSAMVDFAREHKGDMSLIANSIRYADKLPPDFTAILLKDYMHLEDGYRTKLMNIPEFAAWMKTKGRLLNGAL